MTNAEGSAPETTGRSIVFMGVCGTGKTTVGEGVAARLGSAFLEGDSFHPPENVEKMRAGAPLDDEDRWPWLERLGRTIGARAAKGQPVVAACSALKRVYRDRLRLCAGCDILFIMLHGEKGLLAQRMAARKGHYMPPSLLTSQLATLEQPEPDETYIAFDVAESPDRLISDVINALQQPPNAP